MHRRPESTLQLSAEPLTRPQLVTPLGAHAVGHAGAPGFAEQPLAPVEASGPGAAEIASIFKDGRSTLYDIGLSPGFQKLCAEKRIDPYATDKPAYWDAFADFTRGRVADLLRRGGNPPQLKALELMAMTPQYILANHAIQNQKNGNMRRETEVASRFNGKIREFATEFPATRASSMEVGLLHVVSMAVEQKDARQSAAHLIHNIIRGAQHELGFGQLLAIAGRRFRPAALNEDLHGIDYVISGRRGQPIHLDVKASMRSFERGSAADAFSLKQGGAVVYSMLSDQDFGDSFYVRPEIAQMKAPVVADMLNRIEKVAS